MPRRTSACRRSRLLTTHVKRLRGGSAQCALAPISVATCEANPRTCRFSVSWLGRLLSMEMFRPRNADEGVDRDIVLTTADITTTFMIHVSRSVGPFTGGARIIAASSPSTRFTRYRRFSRGEGNVRIGSRASASGRSEVSGSDTLTKHQSIGEQLRGKIPIPINVAGAIGRRFGPRLWPGSVSWMFWPWIRAGRALLGWSQLDLAQAASAPPRLLWDELDARRLKRLLNFPDSFHGSSNLRFLLSIVRGIHNNCT